jgi:VanZ family protein
MNSRKRIIAAGIFLLLYMAIFYFSSLPAGSLPTGIPDYIPHFAEYFLLAFFFIQVFARPRHRAALATGFFILAALGLLDECHQLLVPGRVFSWLDLVWDMTGSLAGMAAFFLFVNRKSEISN